MFKTFIFYLGILFLSVEIHKLGSAMGWWLNGIPAILTLAHDRPFIAIPPGMSLKDLVGEFPIILSKYLGAVFTLGLCIWGTYSYLKTSKKIYFFIALANGSLKITALLIFFIMLLSGKKTFVDEAAIAVFGHMWPVPIFFLLIYLFCIKKLAIHGQKNFSRPVLTIVFYLLVGTSYLLGLEILDRKLGTKHRLDHLMIVEKISKKKDR